MIRVHKGNGSGRDGDGEERVLRCAQDDGLRLMLAVLFLRQAGAGLGDIRCHFKYVMSVSNSADRTAGINVTKNASVGGDPYMYTDFTGATLYVNNAEQTFDLGEAPGFVPAKPVIRSKFRWTAKGGTSTE